MYVDVVCDCCSSSWISGDHSSVFSSPWQLPSESTCTKWERERERVDIFFCTFHIQPPWCYDGSLLQTRCQSAILHHICHSHSVLHQQHGRLITFHNKQWNTLLVIIHYTLLFTLISLYVASCRGIQQFQQCKQGKIQETLPPQKVRYVALRILHNDGTYYYYM